MVVVMKCAREPSKWRINIMISDKTLLQIEQEINDFLHEDNFLKVKRNVEYGRGLQKERIDRFVKYMNKYIKNNIEESICIDGSTFNRFFDSNRYVSIQTRYKLPDGKEEYCNIGTLFAFSTEQDVMNMRIWAESTSLYVRFNEEYLYGDTYHLYSSRTYRQFTIADIHKKIIKRRKDEIIKEYQIDIKKEENIMKKARERKQDIIEKLNATEKWRIY